MTEDEAKTKWCPMARSVGNGENRTPFGAADASCLCLASGCMAWRWARWDGEKAKNLDGKHTGSCGLAGRP